MTPATTAAKNNPQSTLRLYFGAAIEKFSVFLAFLNEITLDGLRAFWGRRKSSTVVVETQLTNIDGRSQLILTGNFLVYLFLLSSSPVQVHATFRLLELFHESLQRLSDLADEDSIGLIRPVALRIDSFFTQASQIMRRGSATGSCSAGMMADGSP